MNGDSRDAGRYGNTRSDAASVHEFVQGFQAAEMNKAKAAFVGGMIVGGILGHTAYQPKRSR